MVFMNDLADRLKANAERAKARGKIDDARTLGELAGEASSIREVG